MKKYNIELDETIAKYLEIVATKMNKPIEILIWQRCKTHEILKKFSSKNTKGFCFVAFMHREFLQNF